MPAALYPAWRCLAKCDRHHSHTCTSRAVFATIGEYMPGRGCSGLEPAWGSHHGRYRYHAKRGGESGLVVYARVCWRSRFRHSVSAHKKAPAGRGPSRASSGQRASIQAIVVSGSGGTAFSGQILGVCCRGVRTVTFPCHTGIFVVGANKIEFNRCAISAYSASVG